MSKRILILLTILMAAVAVGCRKEETPVETPGAAEKALEEQRRQEAARRAEEAAGLDARASALTAKVAELKSSLGPGESPVQLEEQVAAFETRLASLPDLLAALEGAEGDAWSAARDRLTEALAAAERKAQSVAAAAADWTARQQAAREARSSMEMPIDPETGLILGLDGGDYEPYLVSVVERVQQRLRALGLYAGEADGYFDVTTREAVGRFQEGEGLHVSGVPSPMTRARLFAG